MPLNSLVKLDRLCIKAYHDAARERSVASFEADVNIDNFSQYHAIKYQNSGGIGTSAQEATYGKHMPQKRQFNLVLDHTGVFNSSISPPDSQPDSIIDHVNQFLEVCYNYHGEIHSPRFLKIEWGELKFSCKIETADIKYSLFDRGGNPLRAEIDVSFIEDVPQSERNRQENNSSPDITHSHLVKAGDTLTAIAKDVYGSASYYLLLAKANKINHFRNLKAGTEIKLPSLQILETYQ